MLSVANELSSCLYDIADMHTTSKLLEYSGSISTVDDLALVVASSRDNLEGFASGLNEKVIILVCGDRNDGLEKMNLGTELVEPSKCLEDKIYVDQVEKGGFSDKLVRDDSFYTSNDSLKVATAYNMCCAIDKTNVTAASNTCCIIVNATIVSTGSLQKAGVRLSGSFSASFSSSSRRRRHSSSMKASGSVRRSARIRCCRSQSSDEFPDSNTMSGATNSGSGLHSDFGSVDSSYDLGSLSSSQFSQLARDTTLIFINVDINLEYIRDRKLERASMLVYEDY